MGEYDWLVGVLIFVEDVGVVGDGDEVVYCRFFGGREGRFW